MTIPETNEKSKIEIVRKRVKISRGNPDNLKPIFANDFIYVSKTKLD